MASQMWQPGSVAVFVGEQDADASQAIFLGVGVTAPETEFRPKYKPIHNDFGGSMIEADSGFAGEEAFVAVDLQRWDYRALNELADYPGFNPGAWRPPPATGAATPSASSARSCSRNRCT